MSPPAGTWQFRVQAKSEQHNCIMSKGSSSAEAPRLQRGGSCRRGWRSPFPHPGTRQEWKGPGPVHPAPVARLGSGFPSTSMPLGFLIFISFLVQPFLYPLVCSIRSLDRACAQKALNVVWVRAVRWCLVRPPSKVLPSGLAGIGDGAPSTAFHPPQPPELHRWWIKRGRSGLGVPRPGPLRINHAESPPTAPAGVPAQAASPTSQEMFPQGDDCGPERT